MENMYLIAAVGLVLAGALIKGGVSAAEIITKALSRFCGQHTNMIVLFGGVLVACPALGLFVSVVAETQPYMAWGVFIFAITVLIVTAANLFTLDEEVRHR